MSAGSEDDGSPGAMRILTSTSVPLHLTLRRWAWRLLVLGLSAALVVFATAGPDEETLLSTDQRAYDYNVERLGGKATLFAIHVDQWFSSLWHGRSLALTIAVLTLAFSSVGLWLAGRVAEMDREAEHRLDREQVSANERDSQNERESAR